MRIANSLGRSTLVVDIAGVDHGVDLESCSGGIFPAEIDRLFDRWVDLRHWERSRTRDDLVEYSFPIDLTLLGAPSPSPRQVFAVGLNYEDHARESGTPLPRQPPVFTKFVSSFTGPISTVDLPEGNVDWEVELVVVMGAETFHIPADSAWANVAGVTAGQDLSERISQNHGPAPQFSMSKSFPGFSPQGPWLVTPDAFADPDDIELGCALNGSILQKGRTRDLVFSVPRLIEYISATVPLHPGDVIFTGTPAGTALGRRPARFLQVGDELTSWVDGVGNLHQTMSSRSTPSGAAVSSCGPDLARTQRSAPSTGVPGASSRSKN